MKLIYLQWVYGGEKAGERDEREEVAGVGCNHDHGEEQPAAHHHLQDIHHPTM